MCLLRGGGGGGGLLIVDIRGGMQKKESPDFRFPRKAVRYSMNTTCEVKKNTEIRVNVLLDPHSRRITIKLGFLLVCYRSGSRRRIDLDHIFDRDDGVFSDGAPNTTGINYSSSVPSNFDK